MAIFPCGRGLAGTRMFPFWLLPVLELRMMEVVVTTGAVRRVKLQSNHHHQQTNTQLFTGQMPFLLPNQQCEKALKETECDWLIMSLEGKPTYSLMSHCLSTGAVPPQISEMALRKTKKL